MYLRVTGDSFTENMLREIAVQTDQGRLHFKEIEYDDTKGIVSLPIERYKTLKKIRKRRLFRIVITRKYDRRDVIQSTITIRNVTKCHIENNIDDPTISNVTLLFGITIRGHDVILASLQEERGKTCYMMELKVSEIDIEIADKEEK